jgi:hypothetical protein
MNALGTILSRKNRRGSLRVLLLAFLPITVLLLAYCILIWTGVYDRYPEFDNPLHILGGAALAWIVFFSWRYDRQLKLLPEIPFWVVVSYAVGIASVIGIAWEQNEFLIDLFRNASYTPNVADFVKDLTNDILGAFAFSVLAGRRLLSLGKQG